MRIRIFIGIMAYENGAVAQLGERLPCTEEVRSSSLLSSTTRFSDQRTNRQRIAQGAIGR